MHTLQFEQYDWDLVTMDDGVKVLILKPFTKLPFMVPDQQGQPVEVKVHTSVVQVVMTKDTQRRLRDWLDGKAPVDIVVPSPQFKV